MGVKEGEEWEPLAGLGGNARAGIEALLDRARIARDKRPRASDSCRSRPFPRRKARNSRPRRRSGGSCSTSPSPVIRWPTGSSPPRPTSPVSTNLGAWVNQRGLFKRRDMKDVFAAAKIPSASKVVSSNQGQHIELGIAESNLFLMLAALGLSGDLFRRRLVPIGTLYDPVHRPRPR
jgi:pyruvate dehydrogenase E1 component